MKINPKALLLARLTEEELTDLANFDCGDEEMNEYLVKEAFVSQELGMNTTTLLYYEGRLAAFCSICADSIRLAEEEKGDDLPLTNVPAIKIARLGRDKEFKEYGFGQYLIQHTILKALEIAEASCGVRFITLDAYPERIKLYEDIGFVRNESYKKRTMRISMRFDIYNPPAIES
ncbi:GNAT family N-acetyltransferase [Fictibacillus sp. 26RED30]|uniref:GNAT family N-acetyltransferase n=1 Tax=Fictibacillus sp. 26RED30 TaxID=2745877 RepID=UPI0018CE1BB6|nr:GNAT family N-acetyltransferase [Fictibacillus sp. 26RED30]MBH0159897.1 GNAT family N-acetyltransferase [Fictibacillus sp. 26RED30]